MEYLHLFNTKTEHDSLRNGDNYKEPWLAYVRDNSLVTGNKGWSEKYLTFEALESGTFTFTMENKLSTACVESVSYSIDDGETWTTANNIDGESVTLTTPTISEGCKVLWKGIGVQYCSNTDSFPGPNFGQGYFNSTGRFNVSGNIMSMLFGDNFIGEDEFPKPINTGYGAGAFSYLFSHLHAESRNCSIVSAANLILPATILGDYCYSYMFYGCTTLTTAPVLPATILGDYCYSYMFYGCTALTTAPATLPATTLANYCYISMFYGCTALTTAPATLPATTLAAYCYGNMFYDCTALTTAPVLPATTLATYCYSSMFQGCTSLITAPELPATTLATYCYSSMFSGCTSLTAAPELPASTLVSYCYNTMFQGCISLNYIKAMFTTTPSTTYTKNWVSGVASTGTFIKNSAATWNVTGANGTPSGWTVETASSEYIIEF